ncbi:thioredoxin-domain-containing protein [Xylariaceae sp. FL0016]|nr:thioredoxin-domain-containing protein [Xylariaceae sp. FL0016]
MSTNFFLRATQSALRRPLIRPAQFTTTTLRQFHATKPNMVVHNIQTKEAFTQAINEQKAIVLDCFATWCGPCKAIAPLLLKHSNDEKYKDVHFVKIDVDELSELSQELGVTAMPSFMLFKNGDPVPVEKVVGANPKALEAMLTKAVELL